MSPDPTAHVAAILNAGYMVRHYQRGARAAMQRTHRRLAIEHMGELTREAFNACAPAHYEALFTAIVDALRPREEQPF